MWVQNVHKKRVLWKEKYKKDLVIMCALGEFGKRIKKTDCHTRWNILRFLISISETKTKQKERDAKNMFCVPKNVTHLHLFTTYCMNSEYFSIINTEFEEGKKVEGILYS